jgi:hypothetical protein
LKLLSKITKALLPQKLGELLKPSYGGKRMKDDIRWIGVNPEGVIVGPCLKTREETKYALVVGFRRAGGNQLAPITVDRDWEKVKKLGYTVAQCRIELL